MNLFPRSPYLSTRIATSEGDQVTNIYILSHWRLSELNLKMRL